MTITKPSFTYFCLGALVRSFFLSSSPFNALLHLGSATTQCFRSKPTPYYSFSVVNARSPVRTRLGPPGRRETVLTGFMARELQDSFCRLIHEALSCKQLQSVFDCTNFMTTACLSNWVCAVTFPCKRMTDTAAWVQVGCVEGHTYL